MLVRDRRERGDTIIEVMFAFVIFSLVIVGAFMLMNKGVALAQQSLEITQVRSQIDAQVTMVKYLRQQSDDALWRELITPVPDGYLSDVIDPFSDAASCPTIAALKAHHAFFVTRTSGAVSMAAVGDTTYEDAITYSRVDFDSAAPKAYGIWTQITRAEGVSGAYDVHVRACWGSVGTARPMMIGTVARVYDAR